MSAIVRRGRNAAASNRAAILSVLTDWMTSAEVAERVGCSERAARRHLRDTRGVQGVQSPVEGWLYRRRS